MEKYFSSQEPDEQVVMVIRKHWFNVLPSILMAGFVYLMLLATLLVFPYLFPQLVTGFAYNIYILVVSLAFLFNTTYVFSFWLIHHLNVGLITTEHIVEICQSSLFSRRISQLGLDKIQDVSATQKGMSETMFNYGDIDVQTAGELPNFLFTKIPFPNETSQKIMELEEEYCERHGLRAATGNSNANMVQNNQQNGQTVQNFGQPDQPQMPNDQNPEPNIEFPGVPRQ
jgi:hypothetical protein